MEDCCCCCSIVGVVLCGCVGGCGKTGIIGRPTVGGGATMPLLLPKLFSELLLFCML